MCSSESKERQWGNDMFQFWRMIRSSKFQKLREWERTIARKKTDNDYGLFRGRETKSVFPTNSQRWNLLRFKSECCDSNSNHWQNFATFRLKSELCAGQYFDVMKCQLEMFRRFDDKNFAVVFWQHFLEHFRIESSLNSSSFRCCYQSFVFCIDPKQ